MRTELQRDFRYRIVRTKQKSSAKEQGDRTSHRPRSDPQVCVSKDESMGSRVTITRQETSAKSEEAYSAATAVLTLVNTRALRASDLPNGASDFLRDDHGPIKVHSIQDHCLDFAHYTPTARPLKMSRILRSFSRPRSNHQNVKFWVSVYRFEVSQYKHTACRRSQSQPS